MGTVYTTMKKCVEMCCKAGQQYSVQTFDQQLYAIAQQIKWSRPLEFQNHIIRLGGFHTLSCFITSICKLWGDGGLADVLVDSGVYAACTVEQMLSGKQFNRAVRGLTLNYEAVMSLWLASFFDWCGTTERLTDIPDLFWDALLRCDMSSWNEDIAVLNSLFEAHLAPLMTDFREWGCAVSPTFRFWDMFLLAASIMFQNIRAERNGIWSMHLSSVRSMPPFFFVTNRNNFSR